MQSKLNVTENVDSKVFVGEFHLKQAWGRALLRPGMGISDPEERIRTLVVLEQIMMAPTKNQFEIKWLQFWDRRMIPPKFKVFQKWNNGFSF